MSHNKITVASQLPDSNGNISLTLNNLSNVTGTPSEGTFLQYDGSNFTPVSTGTVSVQCIFIGEGGSDNYPRTLSQNDEVCFYDTSPYNTIANSTLNLLEGETNWYKSISLPAGTFYMRGTCIGDFTSSASPNMTYRFYNGSSNTGASGASYDSIASGGQYPYESTALFTLSSSATVYLKILTVSNANSTTTTNQSLYGHLYIMKVG
jgi:hypothetical protein